MTQNIVIIIIISWIILSNIKYLQGSKNEISKKFHSKVDKFKR